MAFSRLTHASRTNWRLPATGLLAAAVMTSSSLIGTSSASAQETYTIELGPRWSLVGYSGPDNIDIADALEGTPAEGRVTAIYQWVNAEQRWNAWFPAGQGIPGANDFTTFDRNSPYFIAINGDTNVSWPID